jgi:hypothetical protein
VAGQPEPSRKLAEHAISDEFHDVQKYWSLIQKVVVVSFRQASQSPSQGPSFGA